MREKRMNSFQSADDLEFYPNECIVCHKTRDLKRCSRCNMISYCGIPHQKDHWPEHSDFCRTVSTMMKERGVSHIFEKLRGADPSIWKMQRMSIRNLVELKLRRRLLLIEDFMFRFPRSCFVCYESRQDLLTNCPGCPSASFCKDHPSSPIHDKDCAIIKQCHKIALSPDTRSVNFLLAMSSVINNTKVSKYSKLPSSLREYLCKFAKPTCKITENLTLGISDFFTAPLTIHSSLRILGLHSLSQLTLHIGNYGMPIMITEPWESLLHLLPNLKELRILMVDYSNDINFIKETNVKLCSKCLSGKRKLSVDSLDCPYEEYIQRRDYEKPDLVIYTNKEWPEEIERELYEDWKKMLMGWSKLNLPLIVTNFRERENALLIQKLLSFSKTFKICFNGYNPFAALAYIRAWEDGGVGLSNQYLTIIKSQGELPKGVNISTKEEKLHQKFFYAGVCFVCQSTNTTITCKRCKMIFYCGKAHQTEDQYRHKDICKVILGMLNESGAPNLFDKLKTTNSESWLKVKMDLMRKAQLKLGRKLLDYEGQMFLFPKTCFVCHESDLSVLRNCSCGINLCKIHKEDPGHKELCRNLSLAFHLTTSGQPRICKATMKSSAKSGDKNLPSTMLAFINLNLNLKIQTPELHVPDSQEIHVSDFLTKPLTLLWSLEKLKCKIKSSMVVHVIGTANSDISAQEYWKIILYFLHNLKSLTIVFIGPELSDLPSAPETGLEFSKPLLSGKKLRVESQALMYKEYFKSEFFLQPDVIVGYNLRIHESEFRIFYYSWEETVLTLKKVDAPFILTAGSEERARKDHKSFCKHLGKLIDYVCCERNPFSGLIPERDFETERLMYSNQFVIIYNKVFEKEKLLASRNIESNSEDADKSQNKTESIKVVPKKNEISAENVFESVTEPEVTEKFNCNNESKLCNDKFLGKNSLSLKKDELIKENIFLKKENEEFEKRIECLKLENERLAEENRRIEAIEGVQ